MKGLPAWLVRRLGDLSDPPPTTPDETTEDFFDELIGMYFEDWWREGETLVCMVHLDTNGRCDLTLGHVMAFAWDVEAKWCVRGSSTDKLFIEVEFKPEKVPFTS
jgi:hypothetical protein